MPRAKMFTPLIHAKRLVMETSPNTPTSSRLMTTGALAARVKCAEADRDGC